jgi:radical SAM protein with 4Fe4S-binding SPASM domain
VNCRSPFTALRVDYHGNVHLCQSLFRIGNLRDGSVIDLWYGRAASRVRRGLLRDASVCHACDYYRFCVNPAGAETSTPSRLSLQQSGLYLRASSFAHRARLLGPRLTLNVVADKLQRSLAARAVEPIDEPSS